MPEEISLEKVLKRCGDFGRYQWIHYIFLNLFTIISGISAFFYVFGVAEPPFRCRLPSSIWADDDRFQPINITHKLLIDTWLSSTSKCDGVNRSICTDFVYDRSVFGRTFTEDANFVCADAVKKTWLSTSYRIGTCTVLLSGPAGDKFGRRKVIRLLCIGSILITAFTQLLLQFINEAINVRFILLLVNQFASSIDPYCMVFLLLMELTSSSHTSFAGNLAMVSFTLGEVLATIFAYFACNWLKLKWLTTGYVVLILPYLYFVPESPYWLFSQKKYRELEICLRKIATTNGHTDADWLPHYRRLISEPRFAISSTKQTKRTDEKNIARFLPKLSISGLIAFVTMLLYIKISYGLGAMNETVSPYSNIIIGAVIESIGYVTASILLTTRLGRKYTLMIYTLLTTICVLIIPFIMKSHPIMTVVTSQMGKLTISGAVSASWIYVPELFPTSMRGLANGVFVCVGRFGAILAPIVDAALGEKYVKITFYVYSALTMIVVGVICFLPETRNRSFDDGKEIDNRAQTELNDDENHETDLL